MLTYSIKILEHFADSDQLVIQFIVGGWAGQEVVSVRDEQVEHFDDLYQTESVIIITPTQRNKHAYGTLPHWLPRICCAVAEGRSLMQRKT